MRKKVSYPSKTFWKVYSHFILSLALRFEEIVWLVFLLSVEFHFYTRKFLLCPATSE